MSTHINSNFIYFGILVVFLVQIESITLKISLT